MRKGEIKRDNFFTHIQKQVKDLQKVLQPRDRLSSLKVESNDDVRVSQNNDEDLTIVEARDDDEETEIEDNTLCGYKEPRLLFLCLIDMQ